MKLKKIVSLALAGILAVSMLTACGDTDKKDPASSNETSTATGYSAMLGKKAAETLEKNDHDDVFTFADDADAQKALKKAVLDNIVQQNIENVIRGVSISGAWAVGDSKVVAVETDFQKEMKAAGISGMSSAAASVNTTKFASVWVANGDIAMDTVMNEVFADIKESFKNAKEDDSYLSSVTVDYAYEVSVSVENVAMKYDTTKTGSVNFIAVTVTRTAEIA